MRSSLGELHPSRAVARRMHELESELQQARMHLRRHSKSPDTTGRWGLEQPTEAQQEEGWFVTYLDMMTLLLVVMIVMLAFSGHLGGQDEAPSSAPSPASEFQPTSPAQSTAQAANTVDPVAVPDTTSGGEGLLPGGTGLLHGDASEIHTESAAGTDLAAAPRPAAAGRPPVHPADVGPLPRSATVLFGINVGPGTGPSMVERVHGWGAADLSASFIGPPRPDEQSMEELAAATVSADWADHSVVLSDVSISAEAGTDESADNSEADSTEFGSESGGEAIGDATMVDTPVRRTPTEDTAQTIETRSEGELLAADLALGELGSDVEIVVNERSVSFRVNSEILFDSSQADLSRTGLGVLRNIVSVLTKAGYDVTVEGHTDAVPVRRNVRYPSNWELSSARAGSVVRYLQANGIDRARLKAVGYADTRPIADNHTPEGRARNRRVELMIEKRE